ncbi:hypothetical protein [Paenirhodobacter populi]|uniref:hypothetical protein n=1 Tax=Paenirhodobacter populi TaxID=2306993 RepID=UPI0013E3CCEC|nr:hypothetical protein [Sinirhodobacter populi]
MVWVLEGLKAGVSVVIIALNGVAFIPREAATWLIPLQNFLTRKIEQKRGRG